MDLRELKSFILLADQLNFGRASRLLHLSQPALTKQIQRMEEELGSPLFLRGKGGTSLTTFGEQFLQEARPLLSGFDLLLDHGQRLGRGEIGQLRLGFGFHTLELVPKLLVAFRKTHPGVQLSLRDLSTAEQLAALRKGKIDLGFVRLPVAAEFEALPVVQDRLALVSSWESGLSVDATLADCRNLPFVAISPSRSPGFYQHMLAMCARYKFSPNVVQEVLEFTTGLALVRAGLGVALIPQSFWTSGFSGIQMHPIRHRAAQWNVGAVWKKKDTNPALRSILKLLKSGTWRSA